MLESGRFAADDMTDVRRTIERNGWATLAVNGEEAPLMSHLPCLVSPLDPGGSSRHVVVEGHLPRADPVVPFIQAGGPVLLAFQGPHGYVSAGWYHQEPSVPTWNYVAVHITGVAEELRGEDAMAILRATVEHFEAARPDPWVLSGAAEEYARRIASAVFCFRVEATLINARRKLSQDKEKVVVERVIEALREPSPYHAPRLAEEMERAKANGGPRIQGGQSSPANDYIERNRCRAPIQGVTERIQESRRSR